MSARPYECCKLLSMSKCFELFQRGVRDDCFGCSRPFCTLGDCHCNFFVHLVSGAWIRTHDLQTHESPPITSRPGHPPIILLTSMSARPIGCCSAFRRTASSGTGSSTDWSSRCRPSPRRSTSPSRSWSRPTSRECFRPTCRGCSPRTAEAESGNVLKANFQLTDVVIFCQLIASTN